MRIVTVSRRLAAGAALAAAFAWGAGAGAGAAFAAPAKAAAKSGAPQGAARAGAAATVHWVDRIAAIVNQDVITEKDLSDVEANLIKSRPGLSPEMARRQALDELINQKLVLQIARAKGVDTPQAEVDAAEREVARSMKLTIEQLEQQLKKEGVEREQFRKTLKEKALAQYVTSLAVESMTKVSPQEVAQYVQMHPDLAPAVTQYRAQHILLAPGPGFTPDSILKTLADVKRQAQEGTDFGALAYRYSHDKASAAQYGDLGWLSPGQTEQDFENALFKLKPGEISDPVRTPFGWHLIKLNETRVAKPSPDEMAAIAQRLLAKQKAKSVYGEWIKQLRDAAYIEIKPKPY